MVFSGAGGSGRIPRTPTLFRGEQVALYDTYAEAQRAVDFLSDERFPVHNVAIVGTDLRMVERVTGRLSYGRVAAAGAFSGIYFGAFVGLLLLLFGGADATLGLFFAALLIAAGLGMLFGVLAYAFTGGRRDFTSASQIVATQYAVLALPEVAGQARQVLARLPGGPGTAPGAASGGPATLDPSARPSAPSPVAGPDEPPRG